MAGACGLIGTGIPAIVNNSLGYVEGIANQQIASTNAALGQMASAIAALKLVSTPDAPSLGDVPSISAFPETPEFTEVPEPKFPQAPGAAPSVATISADFPDAPDNKAQRPNIAYPTAPAAFSGTAPVSPGIGTVDIPPAPDIDTAIPVPDLLDITVPASPDIIYPEFDAVLAPHGLKVPDAIFNYSEDFYDSALLQTVISKLINDITLGTTGLHPDAEYAIWARGSEREAAVARTAKDDALTEGAARGFTYPTGAVVSRLDAIEQGLASKQIDLSREIMIEQARLAQNNMQFAIKSGIELEGQIMNYANQYAQRAFEAAKTAFLASFQAFEASVNLYNATVTAYKIEAEVYKTRMDAAIARLEAFRAEIEAQKLIGEINKDSVAIYTAQLQALQVEADVYKSLMQGASIAMEIEKTKIDAYKSEVDAFEALVRANKTEFDAYSAQINAELGKVQVYTADISAFEAQIRAYAAETTAESSRISALATVEEIKQKSYIAKTEAYRAQVSAEAERLRAYVTKLQSEVEVYKAEVMGYSAETDANVKVYDTEARMRIAAFQQAIEGVRIELDASLRATQMAVAAIDGAAKNSAAIAASSINAINVSAGLSESTGNSTSCTTTYSY